MVCGVTYNGTFVDFPVECYACKQRNIAYYYNQTCSSLSKQLNCITDYDLCAQIQCREGYTCIEGSCVEYVYIIR